MSQGSNGKSKNSGFAKVPNRILQDTRMRTETRLVLAWMLSRPPDWKFNVWHIKKTLGLTYDRWQTTKSEMTKFGHFAQYKFNGPNGKFEWRIEMFEDGHEEDTAIGLPIDGGTKDGPAIDE
jgi:hypothetical protein